MRTVGCGVGLGHAAVQYPWYDPSMEGGLVARYNATSFRAFDQPPLVDGNMEELSLAPFKIADGDMEMAPPANPVLVDGDMEAAPPVGPGGTDWDMALAGTAQWNVSVNQTATKVVGPEAGQQALRLTRAVAGGCLFYHTGNLFTVGRVFRLRFKARGDGTNGGEVHSNVGVLLANITSSAAWQDFDVTFVNDGLPGPYWQVTSASLGAYIEVGPITVEDISATAWTANNSAIVSKQTTTPHSGTQCLRVKYNGVVNPYANQSIMAVGHTYRIRGWARGDGVTTTPVIYAGATTAFSGTSSTAWQQVDVTVVQATSLSLSLLANGTGYAEFDDITVEDVTATYWTAAGSAVISKQTTTPYQGMYCLRVTRTAGSYSYANQACLVSGAVYRFRGVMRGDGLGTSVPAVYIAGGILVVQGTNSNTWQPFDVTIASNSTRLDLANVAAGGYVEFDAIQVDLADLVDGSMEAADTTAWTNTATCTITKETASPHGGTRHIRIARGSTAAGGSYQVRGAVGRTYRVRGWHRSDGVALPQFQDGAGVKWTGTNEQVWTAFDFTFTQGAAVWGLYCSNLAAGRYVDFDDITVEDVTASAWASQNAAIASKREDPYAGTRCLRVTYNGTNHPYVIQAVLTTSAVYRVRGWCRSDGTAAPKVFLGTAGVANWTGTTTAGVWQYFDIYGVANNVNLALQAYTTGAAYCEFDQVTCERLTIADQDMEYAGVGSWTATGSSLSKVSVSPYKGTQNLKITATGAAYFYATQSVLVTGGVYHVRGRARSDGTRLPEVWLHNTKVWTGTSSTDWQAIDVYGISTGGGTFYLGNTGYATGFVEFDDMIVEPAFLVDGDMELAPPANPALVDGDMEAVDAAAWGVGSSATLSKQGGAGARVLRIAYNAVNNPYAYQTILTTGKVYRITGQAKSDGTAVPKLYTNDGTVLWTGTTSTSMQPFDVTFKSANPTLGLYSWISGAGYTEWDNIVIENLSATAWSDNNAVVSKQTTTPHGGSRCLRVAFTGAAPFAYQNTLVAGQTYRVRGWVRSQILGRQAYLWIGTGSLSWNSAGLTDWTYFDVTGKASNTTLGLGMANGSVGEYVEFDDVTVENVSASALLNLGPIRRDLVQATATKMPGIVPTSMNGKPVIRLDGVDDFMKLAFPLRQPEYVVVVAKWTKQADSRYLVDGNATNSLGVYHAAGLTQTAIWAGGGFTGPNFTDATAGCVDALFNGVVSAISVNFGTQTVGTVGATDAAGITLGAVGAGTGFWAVADVAELLVFDHPPTPAMRARLKSWATLEYGTP